MRKAKRGREIRDERESPTAPVLSPSPVGFTLARAGGGTGATDRPPAGRPRRTDGHLGGDVSARAHACTARGGRDHVIRPPAWQPARGRGRTTAPR